MSVSYIKENDFKGFVDSLIKAKPVYGPTAKRSKFVFDRLESSQQLRLDYDVTLLPPKKHFFPTAQDLVRFDGNRYEGCIRPEEKVLLGVHFYDVKGLDMTDLLFTEKHMDWNYMAHRESATIVASSIQTVAPRSFWGSIGKDVQPKGHDAFLTKVSGGYVYEARTPKGEALLKHGSFAKASDAQAQEARKVNADILAKCPEKLDHAAQAVAKKVRDSFKKGELWNKLAEDCFSCGSCNTVCPTCYCFDVQDAWNVDQKSGARTRYWDSCLTEEFAKISHGAGAGHNFREQRGDRFRHRFMRKAAYLNEKLGGPACVGCGRCSTACTVDIADPVRVIDAVMKA
ncbi:MAG: 4Fe-4S dicluster domain-containing protein [Elusimicrobiota bacterium]|jgi:formate hydrogenlyase subunit 6/NADH:ubiquinone oxidoreductase subunit I